MLYSIIPPILIILSLSGIIVFFMKKASRIASLEEEGVFDMKDREARGNGFFGRLSSVFRRDNIKHAFLTVSDKMTRRARIMFLRLENKSKNLNDSIRHRKNLRFQNKEKSRSAIAKNSKEDEIIEKVKNYGSSSSGNSKKNYFSELKRSVYRDRGRGAHVSPEDVAEKKIRPTVSDRVTIPSAKAEMKDRLEDLLIERIAVNPKDIEAYERLGEYYMEIGNANDAKECYKQVLKLDPKNRNVKYRMRRLETMMHK